MRRSFTLVELMIVVAIMMVLASVAIPYFAQFQLKARRAEADLINGGLQTASASYVVEFGSYPVDTGGQWHPDPIGGKVLRTWGTPPYQFQQLGFTPDGFIRGSYSFDLIPTTTASTDFHVFGMTDVDGNGVVYALDLHTLRANTEFKWSRDNWCFDSNPMTPVSGPCF